MRSSTWLVNGMTCAHCVQAVQAEVGKLAGVASVQIDLERKQVVVTGDEIDDAAVVAAVDEAGYDAVPA